MMILMVCETVPVVGTLERTSVKSSVGVFPEKYTTDPSLKSTSSSSGVPVVQVYPASTFSVRLVTVNLPATSKSPVIVVVVPEREMLFVLSDKVVIDVALLAISVALVAISVALVAIAAALFVLLLVIAVALVAIFVVLVEILVALVAIAVALVAIFVVFVAIAAVLVVISVALVVIFVVFVAIAAELVAIFVVLVAIFVAADPIKFPATSKSPVTVVVVPERSMLDTSSMVAISCPVMVVVVPFRETLAVSSDKLIIAAALLRIFAVLVLIVAVLFAISVASGPIKFPWIFKFWVLDSSSVTWVCKLRGLAPRKFKIGWYGVLPVWVAI